MPSILRCNLPEAVQRLSPPHAPLPAPRCRTRLQHIPSICAAPAAQRALQSGLEKRGFEVLRLNTYDTVPVTQLDAGALEAAKQAAVVTVGSPSAIK